MIQGAREHRVVTDDGVELAVVEAGDPVRPTLWFLHGFPDCREVWEPVMARLAADYHVVAYDARGAGRSSAPPPRRRHYALARLEEDFLTVLDELAPYGPVHLIGHGWGSAQGWEFATSPRLQGGLASFTSISGPCLDHAALWARDRLRHPTPANLWALAEQGAWLYRANLYSRAPEPLEDRVAHVPVQVVLPEHDPYLSSRLYQDIDRWTPVLHRRTVDAVGPGDRLPLTRPGQVAGWVAEFVDQVRVGSIPSVKRVDHVKEARAS
ncbi:pimeloyl-ACP methyl ester carboxylesterase [Streptacidiphilus sp. BW17]|uniref:alpha/beta fold hydrolase n=1 Tax=Streptacidiphilus sp. BW17 TaxID=3156274 RepID=UPI00351731AD